MIRGRKFDVTLAGHLCKRFESAPLGPELPPCAARGISTPAKDLTHFAFNVMTLLKRIVADRLANKIVLGHAARRSKYLPAEITSYRRQFLLDTPGCLPVVCFQKRGAVLSTLRVREQRDS
jgi:hypothetical protein